MLRAAAGLLAREGAASQDLLQSQATVPWRVASRLSSLSSTEREQPGSEAHMQSTPPSPVSSSFSEPVTSRSQTHSVLSSWHCSGVSGLHAVRPFSAAAPSPTPVTSPPGLAVPSSNAASPAAAAGPASPTYTVEVLITAFERRYLDAASRVIQDLFMIDFAPKAASSFSARRKDGQCVSAPFGVTMGAAMWNVPVNWKRSRFTLTKGPHIDKFGMEQFEVRKYKKAVVASTQSACEVHWLLEHLKLYEFTGVQLEVAVTGTTYLVPPATAARDPAAASGGASGTGVLAQHRADIARYLGPGSALAAAAAAAGEGAQQGELAATLGQLRGAVLDSLEARREALKSQDWYQAWHHANKPAALRTPSLPPGRGGAADAASSPSVVSGSPLDLSDPAARNAAALLSALDTAMLSLRFDALERHSNFQYHFATAVPGSTPLPAAQWMHAVLKYGQYKQRLLAASQEAQLLLAYTGYTVFAHTLLHTLLKVWTQAVVSEAKPYLALPGTQEVAALSQKQQQQAGAGANRGASGRASLFPQGR